MTNLVVEGPAFELRHRLARAMEVAGVSAADMADYLEVSEGTIFNYTSGRTTPKRGALRSWALRTGVAYPWLVNGTIEGPSHTDEPESGRTLRHYPTALRSLRRLAA